VREWNWLFVGNVVILISFLNIQFTRNFDNRARGKSCEKLFKKVGLKVANILEYKAKTTYAT
jgi:hypothetical protein